MALPDTPEDDEDETGQTPSASAQASDDQDGSSDDGETTLDLSDDDTPDDVQDTDDGGALVNLGDDDAPPAGDSEHFSNLAETLDPSDLAAIASDLLDAIERDQEARKKRDEQYREGLERTGAGVDAPGGADFDGASRVTHPVLTQAAIDFNARIMKEIFPPDGPVKDKIVGQPTAQKLEKAKRKQSYMNWQLTEQIPEFRSELEQCLTQTPLSGVNYIKMYHSPRLGRPTAETVFVDDMILPYAASSFLTAERKTHIQRLTEKKWDERIASGEYVDPESGSGSGILPEQSASAEVADRIEGKDADAFNTDGLRTVYEVYCALDVEEEGVYSPYVVTIDESSRSVVALYRNWEEEDEHRVEMQWFAEFPFLPWRGAYAIGLIHAIGGLAAAATGALRALLDSAHINNAATAIKLQGGGKGGQNLSPSPGEIVEIDGSTMVDDIRKLIMPLPYNQPSPVLFQLLGFTVQAAQGVVQTSFEKLSDQNPNQPVGTTLALIEQGMTVFSAIHARQHAGMAQLLKILHRINKFYMDDREVVEDTGELLARRRDFEGPMDVVPVSDPNIFSEAQRMAQMQMVLQRATGNPLYDAHAVEEMFLERTKLPDAKALLVPKPQPQQMNAVNENAAAAMGKPVVAFPEQDHIAHLQTHISFMQSPVFGTNPVIGKKSMPILVQHLAEHLVFFYVTDVYHRSSGAAGVPVEKLMDMKDSDIGQEFDRLMAQASDQSLQQAAQLGPMVLPVIQQAIQFIQQFQPPMPMDPSVVAGKEIERKAQADQQANALKAQQLQIEQQKLGLDAQQSQQEAQMRASVDAQRAETMQTIAQTRESGQNQRQAATILSDQAINASDNETAKEIAAAKIMTGHSTGLEDGRGLNPNPQP